MEIGIASDIKTYSGGLGVLEGDKLKSAADMKIPLLGISLLYNNGYFTQRIRDNRQVEIYTQYDPRKHMTELDAKVCVPIENRNVQLRAWLYEQEGVNSSGPNDFKVPIIFLDTNGDENSACYDKMITDSLYKETPNDNKYWRIAQEIVLGIGGIRMLHELNRRYPDQFPLPKVYHLNEGHGAFAALELLRIYGSVDKVKERTVFTTHTPVSAGHDWFNYGKINDMMGNYLKELKGFDIRKFAGADELNMTWLAMNMSRFINAVSKLHGQTSKKMFPDYEIDYITNGVHTRTWASPEFQRFIYDKYFPNWKDNPGELKNASIVPASDLINAHYCAKQRLIDYVDEHSSVMLDPDIITIGFARRFAGYKRGNLIFSDLERLIKACSGRVQFVFAGKAHPNDNIGKGILHNILDQAQKVRGKVNIAFLENYNMYVGSLLTSGCDIWLNLPRKPNEACGTSGMKAAHNAVLNISTQDGWWAEVKDIFGKQIGGWPIGQRCDEKNLLSTEEIDKADGRAFYNVLEKEAIPAVRNPEKYAELKREGLVLASHFNSHRMLEEYVKKVYGGECRK
jgi:alpha-glucan phosphorylase-like protein